MATVKKGDKVVLLEPVELVGTVGRYLEVDEIRTSNNPFWQLKNIETGHIYMVDDDLVLKLDQ